MIFPPDSVPRDVAQRQLVRYRMMTAAEKLACADALWDLAWDATKAGIRLRRPDRDEAAVTREARAIFCRATD